MGGNCLLLAHAPLVLLYLAAPVAGLSFGALWSLLPALASELAGLTHVSLSLGGACWWALLCAAQTLVSCASCRSLW